MQVTVFQEKILVLLNFGNGPIEIFYSASIHANEWITSVLSIKFIEEYCYAYSNKIKLNNVDIKNLFETYSIYIMPMVNPDGVDLVTGFLDTTSEQFAKVKNIANDYPSIPFPERLEGKY